MVQLLEEEKESRFFRVRNIGVVPNGQPLEMIVRVGVYPGLDVDMTARQLCANYIRVRLKLGRDVAQSWLEETLVEPIDMTDTYGVVSITRAGT